MLKKIWRYIWEGGWKYPGIKGILLSIPALVLFWYAYKACLHFNIPSPYAEALLFVSFLVPIFGMTWLSNSYDQRRKSKSK